MKLFISEDSLTLDNKIILSSSVKKKDILALSDKWEEWLKNDQKETVSYRLKINDIKNSGGNVYLIVTFKSPINNDSLLVSWFLCPEKIINGEQKKINGPVTKGLRKWFLQKTGETLPKGGDWGDIDAIYDSWNQVGMIVCNYRAAFKSNYEWEDYRKRNGF
jgi:hypothetical protein